MTDESRDRDEDAERRRDEERAEAAEGDERPGDRRDGDEPDADGPEQADRTDETDRVDRTEPYEVSGADAGSNGRDPDRVDRPSSVGDALDETATPDPSPDARPRADAPQPPADEPSTDDPAVEEAFELKGIDLAAERADAPDERIVSKRAYCERCEYFSAPPEVRCTHDGTEILEMVDRRQFRVVNCPVVAEREELAHEDDDGREVELEDDDRWRGDIGPE